MIKVNLEGVPQTLLLPLAGRARLSQENNSIFNDKHAISLIQELEYDFDSLIQGYSKSNLFWWLARAYQFDKIVKTHLVKYPKTTIVNLGAGLETAFYRVDNGKLTWVDIDLPEVIELKRQLLPPPDRVHYIAASILDNGWVDKIKQLGDNFIFISAGVLMYFTESQLKNLFLRLGENFSDSILLFDFISKQGIKYANRKLETTQISNVKINWGINHVKEILEWLPIGSHATKLPYFKGLKTKLNIPLLSKLKLLFFDLFDKGGLAIVKLQK